MKNFNLRMALAALCLLSFSATFNRVQGGPVRFDQVVQIMNTRPGKADTGNFTRLSVASYYSGFVVGDDDDDKKSGGQTQDGRVITETKTDIVEDDVCDCVQDEIAMRFPRWALLGLAGIPIALVIIRHKKTPTPTPSIPLTPTPTPTPTVTPTPTPTVTPTPTPMTPTPTPPQTVPEPMTILLFGTGLASIGLAARRRFGKKDDDEEAKEDE